MFGAPQSGQNAKLTARSFTLDAEAVVCGPDGVAVFDALHRHGTVSAAMLYACGANNEVTRRAKDGRKTRRWPANAGAGLSWMPCWKAPSERPAFQPYRGKLAVRHDRGDGGNVGIIRSLVRGSILPDPAGYVALWHMRILVALQHTRRHLGRPDVNGRPSARSATTADDDHRPVHGYESPSSRLASWRKAGAMSGRASA